MKSIDIHYKLQSDLAYFCEKGPMTIKTKAGDVKPLLFNKAQKFIHKRLEKQLLDIGKVRAYILKGRQQGCSTYIAARFYHKSTRKKGLSTFILSHEGGTTDKLFKLVKRYHEGISAPLKPSTRYSNRKELVFDKLNSDYSIGTAGNEDVGRGGTIQLFHGSEAAFWSNTDELRAGLLQSISDESGTEIIFESTANGMGNMFHQGIMSALKGETEYQVIFVPWFWQDEYTKKAPSDFLLTQEEEEYALANNLNNDQMYWRRVKIVELDGIHRFRQEYPANIHEAFMASGKGLIDPKNIMNARECDEKYKNSPLVIGVDPARTGDRTALVYRRGREVPKFQTWPTMDSMRLAGIVAQIIEKHNPEKVFIDVGFGHGTIDRLHELGFSDIVTGVNFGERAIESDIYINKRAEMWLGVRDWIAQDGVNIPDSDELQTDLSIIPDYLLTSSGKKKLELKDKIKADTGLSPDIGDALALTFAYPVSIISNKKISKSNKSEITTMTRRA